MNSIGQCTGVQATGSAFPSQPADWTWGYDAPGRVTHRHYDDNDRLIGIECAAATAESRTSILDQEGQVLKILHGGHDLPDTTALTADVRHVGMVYDRLGRVTSETSAGVTHSSTWDKGGNRLTVTYGGTGRVLTSTYDKLQRLETLSEKLPSETTSRLTDYAYDKNGNVTGKTHPNGTAESTSYDALNRRMVHQVTVGSTVLSSFTFSHDKLSNVAQIIETYDASAGIAGRTVTNTYDKTRRLHVEIAAEPGKTVATTYGYDKANNRTSKVVATTPTGGSTTTATHGYIYGNTTNGLNSNQVWKWIKPNGGGEVVYSYDANGNRATRTETIGGTPKTDTYTWDHWNRLTGLDLQSKASAVNGTYAYGYDHRTRRVVRDESTISGRTRDLVIFSGGTSVQEHEGETGATPANTATPDMEYIRGSDWGGGVGGILYTSRAGVVSWAHYNGRGDVVTRTSGTGSLTYAASYEAFGTRTQEAGTNPDRQRANTKEEDPTGLLNEGFRYRDLELGMFISRDPAGFVDGPNVYTYVVQNPWSSFDPEGLEAGKLIYSSLDEAMAAAPLAVWNYKPKRGERSPQDVEYASNIFYDANTKKYGYSEPYGNQSQVLVYTQKHYIEFHTTWVGSTHNHPLNYNGKINTHRTEFSETGTALGPGNDKRSAEINNAPLGLVTTDPKTGELVRKKYTPGGSAQDLRENGTVTQYDPQTKTYVPVKKPEPASTVPAPSQDPQPQPTGSIKDGRWEWQMPDGSTQWTNGYDEKPKVTPKTSSPSKPKENEK